MSYGWEHFVAFTVQTLALIAASEGSFEPAGRLLGFVDHALERLEAGRETTEAQVYERLLGFLHKGLDDAALGNALASGRGLSAEAACALALGGPGRAITVKMPLRSIRLRFLALVLVAAGAACGAHQTGGALPSSPFAIRGPADADSRRPYRADLACGVCDPFGFPRAVHRHARRWIRRSVSSRTVGTGARVHAFGNIGRRLDLDAAEQNRPVRAAQTGKARYYSTFRGYQNVAVITAKGGVQILYAPLYFANKKVPKSRNIRAGQVLARAGSSTLHFEITDGTDPSDPTGEQLNPCGNADGATGTMSIVNRRRGRRTST